MQAAGCGVLGLTCAAIQLHSAVRPCDHRVPYRGGPRARRERTSCMSHPADRVVEECAHDGARRLVHVHARVRAGDRRDPSDENGAAATSGLISLVATRSATPLVRAQSAHPRPAGYGGCAVRHTATESSPLRHRRHRGARAAPGSNTEPRGAESTPPGCHFGRVPGKADDQPERHIPLELSSAPVEHHPARLLGTQAKLWQTALACRFRLTGEPTASPQGVNGDWPCRGMPTPWQGFPVDPSRYS